MELELVCQGRRISSEQLLWLGQWVADHPQWSRKRLSRELCQEWDWRNGRGRIKDFAARALLEKLAARGWLVLPALQLQRSHPRPKPAGVAPINWPADPISEPVGELASWQWILPLAGTPEAKHFDAYLQRYHYLGLRVVGQNMKYLVRDKQGRDVACLLFGAAAWREPGTGSIYRLGSSATGRRSSLSGQQQSLSDPALGQSPRPGQPPFEPSGPAAESRLATPIRASDLSVGEFCRARAIWRDLLSGGPLALRGTDSGARPARGQPDQAHRACQRCLSLPLDPAFSPASLGGGMSAARNGLIELEREAAEQGRQYGREKLCQRLQAIADAPGLVCPGSGEHLQDARFRNLPLITTLGTVNIRAHYGYDRLAQKWTFAVRDLWGLACRQEISPELEQQLGYTAIECGSYAKAEAMARSWGVKISSTAIHKHVQRLGQEAQRQQELRTEQALNSATPRRGGPASSNPGAQCSPRVQPGHQHRCLERAGARKGLGTQTR